MNAIKEGMDGRIAKLEIDADPHGNIVDPTFAAVFTHDDTISISLALTRFRILRSQMVDWSTRAVDLVNKLDLGYQFRSVVFCVEQIRVIDKTIDFLEGLEKQGCERVLCKRSPE